MYAFSIPNQRFTLVAGEDIAEKKFIMVSTDSSAFLGPTVGGHVLGVSANEAKLGQPVEIHDGVVQVFASGPIVAGDDVASTAGGEAVKVDASNPVAVAIAITGGDRNQVITVKIL